MSDLTLALGALTGGAVGALDAIDGAGLSDGDAAVVVLDSGVYHYHLDATSGATENSPYVISPDSNAGTKRWVLVSPKGPFSHVKATTTTESIPNSSDSLVIYDTEDYDELSEYNNTTGIFTAKYAGFYIVTAGLYLPTTTPWTAGNQIVLGIYKNSSTIVRTQKHAERSASYRLGKNLSASIKLAVNDTLSVLFWQNSGAARTVEANTQFNYFTIDRIA